MTGHFAGLILGNHEAQVTHCKQSLGTVLMVIGGEDVASVDGLAEDTPLSSLRAAQLTREAGSRPAS